LADAALQLFDTGMAITTNKGVLAVAPAALGAVDLWAGLFLLRASRVSPAQPTPCDVAAAPTPFRARRANPPR
jgi:hypothetical protein